MAFWSSAPSVVLCGAFLALPGCERRIDEPVQADQARSEQQQHVSGAEASPQKQSRSKLEACMKPLAAPPARVVSGAVPNLDCPADDLETPPLLPRARVEFLTEAGDKKVVPVEIAREDAHRSRGLMYRKSLPEAEGMLFVFEESRELSFWMHNTCIPLDMIFVSADGTIVGIEENTPTLNDGNFSSGCKARYVIEMNAGWARKNGVQAGQRVKLPR